MSDDIKELDKSADDLNNKICGNGKVRAILVSNSFSVHLCWNYAPLYQHRANECIKYMGFEVYRTIDIRGEYRILYR